VVLSPRAALLILWLFTPLVQTAFDDSWLWPLLGLLFLPSATLMYVLVVAALGPTTI
jgi:cytochrome c oxidase assembly factor CtaG